MRLENTHHDAPSACPATAPKLETLEDAQRFLQEVLHFADELERWEAIEQVCAQFDCEALVEYLLPFLNDPHPLVRVNAIDALEGIPQLQIDVHRAGQRLQWWRRWSRV
jgi:HEAT repeat protein